MLHLHSSHSSPTLSGILSGLTPPSPRRPFERKGHARTVLSANLYCSRVPFCYGALFATNNYVGTTSTRPKRKFGRGGSTTESEELMRVLLRKAGDEKFPLVTTLNKYVRTVRTEHCFLLFEELGRQDKWLQCLEVFRWMQKQRWYIADNGIYSKLISIMGKKGQTRMAMWLFTEMRNSGCKPDTSVYNSLIAAHLHSRDKSKALSKAYAYFEKMKGLSDRCQPNIVTYNILLRAFARSGDLKQVDAIFNDLDSTIISPDIYTYNGIMDAFGKNGMLREMEMVLRRMKSNQCKPDTITYNILIDSYGRKQVFDKMEQVFKSLLRSKAKPTLPTFNSMISNYGKARLKEKAESVFRKMGELGFKPSYVTYECLMMAYGYCDCVSSAREIFDEVMGKEKEMEVSTLNAMLDVYCMNGLPFEADKLLEVADKRGFVLKSSTYRLLYKAYSKANIRELVDKLMKRMEQEGIVANKKFFWGAVEAFGAVQVSS
ncbi:pentatricopeptide repeat-containing protein At4g39620, chloroplastic-like [Phalaenopsis equestris]|uniref:pentatricopeptide repeat-containing protein At4g39620, chloroplastic-like n=1 Tax=Phalaenopsis equestris TaxID=78828 RepID=UPI0009E6311D|nr:pentatricopeptide repeat-containing protein At4g39620, chloroplastic-like [Phalaenopsis equestris]